MNDQQANKLILALREMRRAYGTFHKGQAYISVAYEKELAAANAMADEAIKEAEGCARASELETETQNPPGYPGPCPEGMDWSEWLAFNNVD